MSRRWTSFLRAAFSSVRVARRSSIASSFSGTGSNFDNFAEMAESSARIASLLSFGLEGAMVHQNC